MSSSPSPRTKRAHRLRVHLALTLAAAFVLIAAPVAQAANAVNINVTLPAGYTIAGTIKDNTGAVLSGAYVTAFGTAAGAYGSAVTDGTGKYLIDGLIGTSYKIMVSAPSGKNLVDGYYTTANANHFTVASASASLVTVPANKTGIDVKLPAGLTIAGKITNTTGTALQGASVYVSGPSFDYMSTDASGNYTLKGLASGSYTMTVQAPGDSNYLSGYYTTANTNHFTIAFASATKLTIGPSKTGVNVKLPTGFTISGTIKNTSGIAQPGVDIVPNSTTYAGRGAVTDASGKYTLKGLAAATYKLAISPGSDSAYMDGYYTTTNTNHFTSAASGASGVVVGPNKTAINANIVTGRTISGKVTTTTGVPIEFASVTADNLGHDRSSFTDASGNYVIRGLASTGQKLQVEPEPGNNLMHGYYTSANTNHFTSKQSGATAIVVPPNATAVNIKVPKGYTISGKITVTGGAPMTSAYIDAVKSDYSGYSFTEADGTYLVDGLGSGTYTIQVTPFVGNWESGYYTTGNAQHFTLNVGSATGVTIGP